MAKRFWFLVFFGVLLTAVNVSLWLIDKDKDVDEGVNQEQPALSAVIESQNAGYEIVQNDEEIAEQTSDFAIENEEANDEAEPEDAESDRADETEEEARQKAEEVPKKVVHVHNPELEELQDAISMVGMTLDGNIATNSDKYRVHIEVELFNSSKYKIRNYNGLVHIRNAKGLTVFSIPIREDREFNPGETWKLTIAREVDRNSRTHKLINSESETDLKTDINFDFIRFADGRSIQRRIRRPARDGSL